MFLFISSSRQAREGRELARDDSVREKERSLHLVRLNRREVSGSFGAYPPSDAGVALSVRLRARRPQIEQTVLNRIQAIADPTEVADPSYLEGLQATLVAGLDYALAGIANRSENLPPVPVPMLAQARLAARHGVSLDTVLRRYFAGYALVGDFLIEEAEHKPPLQAADLKSMIKVQGVLFDRLLASVTEEYKREIEGRYRSSEERRFERIKGLLDGELLDTSRLSYRFDGWHVGLVAAGPEVAGALRKLGERLNRISLIVRADEEMVWTWLGGRSEFDTDELIEGIHEELPATAVTAMGEPAPGFVGWRLTHRQAASALPIGKRRADAVVRYADVALVASVVRDDLLSTSLRELYLKPLERDGGGGNLARETLRAYFSANRNVSSAAAVLGIHRNTLANRLRAIELALGRQILSCASDLETALKLEEHESVGAER